MQLRYSNNTTRWHNGWEKSNRHRNWFNSSHSLDFHSFFILSKSVSNTFASNDHQLTWNDHFCCCHRLNGSKMPFQTNLFINIVNWNEFYSKIVSLSFDRWKNVYEKSAFAVPTIVIVACQLDVAASVAENLLTELRKKISLRNKHNHFIVLEAHLKLDA